MDNILTITVEIYRHKVFLSGVKGCDGEYVIGGLKRVSTHANIDDSVTHLALKLKRCEGNMIR